MTDIFEPGEPGFFSELVFRHNWPPNWVPADDQPDKWSERQRADESAAKRARAAETLARRMVGEAEQERTEP